MLCPSRLRIKRSRSHGPKVTSYDVDWNDGVNKFLILINHKSESFTFTPPIFTRKTKLERVLQISIPNMSILCLHTTAQTPCN